MAKKVIEFSFHAAPLTLKGKYKAGGMLLILPISGDGDVTLKISKFQFFFVSFGEYYPVSYSNQAVRVR